MNNKIMDYVKPKDASKYYNVSRNIHMKQIKC